jgi:hypothetical protein
MASVLSEMFTMQPGKKRSNNTEDIAKATVFSSRSEDSAFSVTKAGWIKQSKIPITTDGLG